MGAFTGTRCSAVMRVNGVEGDNRMLCMVWCPGCDHQHPFWVQDPDKPPYERDHVWTWDGDMDAPTFEPSLLVHPHDGEPPQPRCHSFLRAGRWEFLADSEHALAGQTVDMVPLPAWLRSDQ